jgi:hypothetical protein
MTEAEFESLRLGDRVHAGECGIVVGSRGGAKLRCETWRVNGKRYHTSYGTYVPLKHGFYDYGKLWESDLSYWHLESTCVAIAGYQEYMAARRAEQ